MKHFLAKLLGLDEIKNDIIELNRKIDSIALGGGDTSGVSEILAELQEIKKIVDGYCE